MTHRNMARTKGRLAEEAGVNVETVRYYERRGLLEPPPRSPDGWRVYDDHALRTVLFVKRAQRVGFSLDEIQELLDLRLRRHEGSERVRAAARKKLEAIDQRMRDLMAMRAALSHLAGGLEPDATDARPIVDSLFDATG